MHTRGRRHSSSGKAATVGPSPSPSLKRRRGGRIRGGRTRSPPLRSGHRRQRTRRRPRRPGTGAPPPGSCVYPRGPGLLGSARTDGGQDDQAPISATYEPSLIRIVRSIPESKRPRRRRCDQSSLGYEQYCVRLCRPRESPVTVLTLAGWWREVASDPLRLRRLDPSCRVSCINPCTERFLTWVSALPTGATRALQPVGSSRRRGPALPGLVCSVLSGPTVTG